MRAITHRLRSLQNRWSSDYAPIAPRTDYEPFMRDYGNRITAAQAITQPITPITRPAFTNPTTPERGGVRTPSPTNPKGTAVDRTTSRPRRVRHHGRARGPLPGMRRGAAGVVRRRRRPASPHSMCRPPSGRRTRAPRRRCRPQPAGPGSRSLPQLPPPPARPGCAQRAKAGRRRSRAGTHTNHDHAPDSRWPVYRTGDRRQADHAENR